MIKDGAVVEEVKDGNQVFSVDGRGYQYIPPADDSDESAQEKVLTPAEREKQRKEAAESLRKATEDVNSRIGKKRPEDQNAMTNMILQK